MMPKMLYERLDEIGLDFAIVYPTAGLRLPRIKDDETRRAVIRAYNIVSADYFGGLGDRLTPAAIIPMHHPEEAIAELEFVTKQLGSKVGMFGSGMSRPAAPSRPATRTVHYDVLAIDSQYDYDPVWAKCVELGIAPTFHSSASGQGLRNSPTEFRLQPYRPFRRRRPCGRRRRSSSAASRGASRNCASRSSKAASAGRPALRRSDGALGAARRPGAGAHEARQARPQAADGPRREARLRRHRRGVAGARRLARAPTRRI